MSITSRIGNLLLIALLAGWATDAAAIRDIPKEKGWSGNFIFGVGWIEGETNLIKGIDFAEIGRDTVASLTAAPASESDVFPVPPFEIRWTFSENQWQAFIGTTLEEFVALDVVAQLGIRKQAGKAGIFQFGLMFNSIPSLVWEDTYLTGTPRRETDQENRGVRFQWDRIGGTGFEIQMSFRDVDLDLDLNGASQGLTSAQLQSLRRDGDQTTFKVRYLWKLNDKNVLRLEGGFRDNDREGAAVSSDTKWGEVFYSHFGKKWIFAGSVQAGSREYDEVNPVFGVKTDGNVLLANATLLYKLKTASERWSLLGMVAYADEDNDVQFHDNTITMVMAGAQYRF